MQNTINASNDRFVNHKKFKVAKDGSLLAKRSGPQKVLFAFIFVFFVIYAISLCFPVYFLLINSLKGKLEYLNDVNNMQMLAFPDAFKIENYLNAFTNMKANNLSGREVYLYEMFFNSIWQCAMGITSSVAASLLVAYVMAKYKFPGRAFLYAFIIFKMTIPIYGSGGSTMRLMHMLGLWNNPLKPLISSFTGFDFEFLILYGFFSNISWNYAEAVFIDGGGHSTAFFKIMLPQAFPPLITLIIMAFIGAWNDYMGPLLYMPDYPTMASGIYMIETQIARYGDYPQYFAGLVISTLPVIAIYATCSDMIMQNFTVGGLKG